MTVNIRYNLNNSYRFMAFFWCLPFQVLVTNKGACQFVHEIIRQKMVLINSTIYSRSWIKGSLYLNNVQFINFNNFLIIGIREQYVYWYRYDVVMYNLLNKIAKGATRLLSRVCIKHILCSKTIREQKILYRYFFLNYNCIKVNIFKFQHWLYSFIRKYDNFK